MNIKMQEIHLFPNSNGLKSTQERLARQEKRDSQIAFFEQQKENIANTYEQQISELESQKIDIAKDYEKTIAELQSSQHTMSNEIAELKQQLEQATADKSALEQKESE